MKSNKDIRVHIARSGGDSRDPLGYITCFGFPAPDLPHRNALPMKHPPLAWLLLLLPLAAAEPLSARDQQTIMSASQVESKVPPPADPRPQEPFTDVPTGTAGLAGQGIAAFYPQGLKPDAAPPSLALLHPPATTSPLPSSWSIRPRFSSNGRCSRASVDIPTDVDLYGEGEVTGPLRRNGTMIRLWNTDNFNYRKDEGKRLYQSAPWILGVRPDGSSFGILFDSSWKAELDCRHGAAFTAEGPAFPVLVIERPSPKEVLTALGELTGRMELPPLWALGYQQCRYSYYPESQVREIAEGFRSRKIPCDVLWLDIDYMDNYRIFTFDKSYFPDPKQLNDDLHGMGFRTVWMIDPGVMVDENYAVYTQGRANNLYVEAGDGSEYHGDVWPGPCAFPDFTMPEARAWWSGLYGPFLANGVDGIWNDMNEPAVFNGPDGTMPEENIHRGGGDLPPGIHREYHNVYGMLMARATRDGLLAGSPARRPFVLSRSNFLGGQRYAATWTGDNGSSESFMKLSIPMSLSLGLSGQPFSGPDLGGFSGVATPRLWARWVGFGTLFPFARGHAAKTENSKEPWAFGPGVEKTARLALERRYRLLPYLYTLFREASVTGLPVMRPLFLEDPRDPSLRTEQEAFLLGRDLLVVPAWSSHPLPRDNYPVVSVVQGDLDDPDQATLRMRPGSIIPLGEVIQNTAEYSTDSLTLLVCPDADGNAEGCLYEDAGDGFAYRDGDYRLTTFKAVCGGGKTAVMIDGAEGNRPWKHRNVSIQLVGSSGIAKPFGQEL